MPPLIVPVDLCLYQIHRPFGKVSEENYEVNYVAMSYNVASVIAEYILEYYVVV